MFPVLKFAQTCIAPVLRVIYKMRIKGVENIPESGAIVVSNPLSAMDPVFLGCALPRVFSSMAKAEIFKNPIIARFIRSLGGFPVNRGTGDVSAIVTAKKAVDDGGLLVIFPEGTRSKTGEMGRLKPGSLLIALQSGAPIVPAYITPKSGKIKAFKGIGISFGAPVDAASLFEGADLSDIKRSDYRAAGEKLASLMKAQRMEEMQ